MPPAEFIGQDDLRQIFADAFTAFSPLAALVGADATRSLSNHVSNRKQAFAATLAPIGALGIMSTVCKGTRLTALKDLLGTGETDIMDCASELGCGSLHGVVPLFSKRGGLTCHKKTRNAGIAASALIRARWNLKSAKIDGSDSLDFEEISTKFLEVIHMSTLSGRLEWTCASTATHLEAVRRVQETLLQSWDGPQSIWSQEMFANFQRSNDPIIRSGKGAIELHWPTPSMPLEQNSLIVLSFNAIFTVVPITFVVLATIPLLDWQTPRASALLLGGQLLLSFGHFLALWVLRRQRTSAYIDLPRRNFSDYWMLVDNTWFTGNLARRRLSYNPLSPHIIRLGQHVSMAPYIPSLQALVVLGAIAAGFLSFYIGARSSHLYVVLFQIGCFFFANLLKGYVISVANRAYVTPLNNPGYQDVIMPPLESWSWRRTFAAVTKILRLRGSKSTVTEEVPLQEVPSLAPASSSNEKVMNNTFEPYEAPGGYPRFPEAPIPLPRSQGTFSQCAPSVASSSKLAKQDQAEIEAFPLTSATQAHDAGKESGVISSGKSDGAHSPDQSPLYDHQYRVFAKIALRRSDAIGLFFFSSAQVWGTAAHIIYEALHDKIHWTPHMRKEPFLVLPFQYHYKHKVSTSRLSLTDHRGQRASPLVEGYAGMKADNGGRDPDNTHNEHRILDHTPGDLMEDSQRTRTITTATLILALDETINEDVFWMAGMEFLTIRCGAFTDTERLVSEYPDSINGHLIGEYVHCVTKQILKALRWKPTPLPQFHRKELPNPDEGMSTTSVSDGLDRQPTLQEHHQPGVHGRGGNGIGYDEFTGVASMMRAIDIVRRKYAFDSSVFSVPLLRQYAKSAVDRVLV